MLIFFFYLCTIALTNIIWAFMLSPWQWIIMSPLLSRAASSVLADWPWKFAFWWFSLVQSFPSSDYFANYVERVCFIGKNLVCVSHLFVNHNLWSLYPTQEHRVQGGVLALSCGAAQGNELDLTSSSQTTCIGPLENGLLTLSGLINTCVIPNFLTGKKHGRNNFKGRIFS